MEQTRRLVTSLCCAVGLALAAGACGAEPASNTRAAAAGPAPASSYPEIPSADPNYPGPPADHPMTHDEAIAAARAASGPTKVTFDRAELATAKAYARVVPYAKLLELEGDKALNGGDPSMSRNRRVWVVSLDVAVTVLGPPGHSYTSRGLQTVWDVASHRPLPETGAGGMLVTAETDQPD